MPQLLLCWVTLLLALWPTSTAAQAPSWAFSCPTNSCTKQQVASQAQADPLLRDLSQQRAGNLADSSIESGVLQQFMVWAASVGYVGPMTPNSPQFVNFASNMLAVRKVRLCSRELSNNNRRRCVLVERGRGGVGSYHTII